MTAVTVAPRIDEFDEDAWRETFSRYGGLLRSVARSFRLTPQESEDAAAATWLLLVQHAGTVHDPARVGGWLRTTMRRTCLRIVNQRGRDRQDVSARLSIPVGGIGPTRSRALGRLRQVLDERGMDPEDLL
jgi:DNA-directed RNA polymerase specialized sigma24 family protein